jgi:acyl-CoA dehydrogenase
MKIFDTSILDLPFYTDQHRQLARDLEAWVERHQDLPRAHAHLGAAERGRHYTALLGEQGWLAYALDASTTTGRPDLRSLCLIREAFAYLDDLLDFAFAIQGLAASPIAWYGNERQKADVLPTMRAGSRIGTLALSEPACASNLAAVGLTAQGSPDNRTLTGLKTWVSNGNIADHHAVLVRTGEGPGALGLSFVHMPSHTHGLHIDEDIELIAPRAFARLRFESSPFGDQAIIGQPGMGFRYAMEILNFYRVTVGAAALGFCRRATQASVAWARTREIAGSRLIQSQMAMDKLANMSVHLDTSALLVARSAWEFDTGVKEVSAHASMAKLFATEGASRLADDAVQLFGAAGLVADSVPERIFRQVRSLRIYEGTSEIQKIIIAGALARSGA